MHIKKVPAKNKKGYKYACYLEGPPDPVTGKRTQIVRRGETKQEAQQRAEEALHEKTKLGLAGISTKTKKTTFADLAEEWLLHYSKGNVKISTVRVREKEIKILNRYIAGQPVKAITRKQYQGILYDLDDKNYARTTIEGVHVTAGMIFKYAVLHGFLIESPTTNVQIPAKKLTVDDLERDVIGESYLEHDEIKEFFGVVERDGMDFDKEVFTLLLYSGMRLGELLALKESDLIGDEIRITKTLYVPNNNMREYELLTPKTKGSIRTIDLDTAVIELLKVRIDLNHTKRKIMLDSKSEYNDEGFIFCRDNGYPYIQKNFNIRMQRILRKTSIAKPLTPHCFRHTHISLLVEAGVDINTIMRRVGHDDMETTMKIYTHITDKMKKDAAEKIKTHFSNVLNT